MSDTSQSGSAEDSVYRDLFLLSPDAIFIQDYDGTVLDANDEALKLHGMSHSQMIGSNVFDLVPKENHDEVKRDYGRWVTGEMTQTQGNSVGPNGESIPVEIRCSKVTFSGKQALLFHVRDIRDRLETETALRESGERLQHLLDQLHEGVWTLDPAGSTVYANPALLEILGVDEEELKQKDFADFIHERDPRHDQPVDQLLAQMCDTTIELSLVRPDERIVPCHVRATKMNQIGSIRDSFQLSVHDLSETIELRQQLFQSQKMHAFGRMVGGISHDFNNLLMAIMGQAEFLLDEMSVEAPGRADAEKILAIAKRGSSMVRKLLVFSRRESITTETVDARIWIKQVESMASRVVPQNVNLTFQRPDEPLYIQGNTGYLEQVLLNLIINAKDAVGDQGAISVSLDFVKPTVSDLEHTVEGKHVAESEMVCVSVRDNGAGIAPGIIGDIFEPFFSTKPKGKGTGLGLSTAYGIIKQHDGFIAVDSKVNAGTCFKIFLPPTTAPAEPLAPPAQTKVVDQRNPNRLLLVDDDPAVRKVVIHMLKLANKDVIEAETAEEAIEVFQAQPPGSFGLVISDLLLPGKNGIQISEELTAYDAGIPFMLITGCEVAQIQQMGKLPDGAAILHKPFRMAELLRLVDKLTGQEEL